MPRKSARPVSGLSLIEDINRRVQKAYGSAGLHEGQRVCLESLIDRIETKRHVFHLPTGYGKTLVSLACYVILRAMGVVDRCLVIVPFNTLADSIRDDYLQHLKSIGAPCKGIEIVDGSAVIQRIHECGDAEIFISLVHKSDPENGSLTDLLKTHHNWMLVADEIQYYSQSKGKKWGPWLKHLEDMCATTVGISATTQRSDCTWSVFGPPTCDPVQIEDAYDDGVIRALKGHIEDYFVDVEDIKGEVRRLRTEDFKDGVPKELGELDECSAHEMKKGLRFTGKYISGMFSHATQVLRAKQLKDPGEHQMMVFAMSNKHAAHLVDVFRNQGVSADRVGEDRTTSDNNNIMDMFNKNMLDVLVNVDMCGVGYNNPRISVLVFMNLIGHCVKSIHNLGRGLRKSSYERGKERCEENFNGFVCDAFCSPDTPMASLIETMEAQLDPTKNNDWKDSEDNGPSDDKSPHKVSIPGWIVVDAEYNKTTFVNPWTACEIKDEEFAMTISEASSQLNCVDEDAIKDVLMKLLKPSIKPEEQRKQAKDRVNSAVDIYVKNVIRLKTGKSYVQSLYKDIVSHVHREWIKLTGHRQPEMKVNELKQKYNWIKQLNKDLDMRDKGSIPQWADL